jgi:formylglycine-generating enzyme required for sulfatase activity
MKRTVLPLALPCLMLFPASALADDFTGFSMDFVEIGDAGNAADDTGYGAVDYVYRLGVNEVSEAMIGAYNANSGGPLITLDSRGANRPATSVTWNEAARFVNWLNTSSGYSAAYNFTTGGDNITLWSVGDAGYDPANPFRNSNAYYFLPSEDEWYKAAYYDPNANGAVGGYWDYATGSNTAPSAVTGGTASGTAVYGQLFATGPALVTDAGGLSPYGTMAQNGNVLEWGESGFTAPNDSAGESRVIRGGNWTNLSVNLQSSGRLNFSPTSEGVAIGFRVASVPEPSGVLSTVLGAMGLMLKRRRS